MCVLIDLTNKCLGGGVLSLVSYLSSPLFWTVFLVFFLTCTIDLSPFHSFCCNLRQEMRQQVVCEKNSYL
jgi:hypothetical protein